jgi:hypothetical protein
MLVAAAQEQLRRTEAPAAMSTRTALTSPRTALPFSMRSNVTR